MTLLLYTGAARVDAVKLGRHSLKDGRIEYRRSKTRKNPAGVLVNIPVHSDLARVLDAIPRDAFTFLETVQHRARTQGGLSKLMRKWCDDAGLPLCSAHGLRKAIRRRLAEAGATAPEILAVSGHKSIVEVQRYIAAFGRKEAADVAMSKLAEGVKLEQNLTNHPARFVKSRDNHMERNDE